MINVDWNAVMLGIAVGAVAGGAYFMGLAFGMQRALRTRNPIGILTLSAAVRITTLLGVGWIVLGQGGPWAGLGFGAAFFITRFIVTTFARVSIPVGRAT